MDKKGFKDMDEEEIRFDGETVQRDYNYIQQKVVKAATEVEIDRGLYERLKYLGIVSSDRTRSYNVGESDYSLRVIQPWSVWLDWGLNPWDADIVKRICRHKKGEDERIKYEKIKHICDERLRQISTREGEYEI